MMYVPIFMILSLLILLPKASICNDYGFENSETCSERRQRQSKQLKLPCKEIQELGYCLTAGNHYPWRAVSHFINENRGLMKKLYGKQEQFSMLSTELQSNYLHQSDYIVDRHPYRKQMRTDKFAPFNEKASLKNSKLRSKLLKIANSIYNTKFVYNTNLDIDNELPIIIKTLNSNKDEDSILEAVNMSIETNFLDDIPLESFNNTLARNSSGLTEESLIRTKSNLSSSEINITEEETQTVTAAAAAEASVTTFDSLESSTINDDAETSTVSSKTGKIETENNERDVEMDEAAVLSSKIDNEETDSETEMPTAIPTKFEGVNACEVTEEVVAPYWANSTSGEILALLNTYPYEQYVHWEKCRSLNRKMNCRSGCRCEQQHRLYRLLAYDPKNECRGVFMDWFKLPCCCTCKCYDIPTQIKVSSRTPRGGLQKDIFYNYKV